MSSKTFNIKEEGYLSCAVREGQLGGEPITKLGCGLREAKGRSSQHLDKDFGEIKTLDLSNVKMDVRFSNTQSGVGWIKIIFKQNTTCALSGSKQTLFDMACTPSWL